MGKARKDCREGASRTVDPQGQAAMRSGKYGTKETVRERRLRERSTGVSMERPRKAVSKHVTERGVLQEDSTPGLRNVNPGQRQMGNKAFARGKLTNMFGALVGGLGGLHSIINLGACAQTWETIPRSERAASSPVDRRKQGSSGIVPV